MSNVREEINNLATGIHAENTKWWHDLQTGEPLVKNQFFVAAKLMLVVSELAEAMEGHRKALADDKLPNRSMLEVELADAMIRILDLAGGLDLDLGGAIVDKLTYNRTRADHTTAHRLAHGGKAY